MSSLLKGIRFVSADDEKAKKQAKKRELKAQKALLLAKKAAEEEALEMARVEEKERRQRGDDKWINPALAKRLRGGRGSTGESEPLGVSAPDLSNSTADDRMGWMMKPTGASSSIFGREPNKKDSRQEDKASLLHSRQIAKEIAEGKRDPDSKLRFGLDSRKEPDEQGDRGHRKPQIGDGGAEWRRRALKRAREQAEEQGKSVKEVIEERWGSYADFMKGLGEGMVAPETGSKSRSRSGWRDRVASSGRHSRDRSPRRRDRSPPRRRDRSPPRRRDRSPPRRRDRSPPRRRETRPDSPKQTDASDERGKAILSELEMERQRILAVLQGNQEKAGEEQQKAQQEEMASRASFLYSSSAAAVPTVVRDDAGEMDENALNRLAAKVLRAEMRGNTDEATALSAELEKAKQQFPNAPALVPMDQSSHAMPHRSFGQDQSRAELVVPLDERGKVMRSIASSGPDSGVFGGRSTRDKDRGGGRKRKREKLDEVTLLTKQALMPLQESLAWKKAFDLQKKEEKLKSRCSHCMDVRGFKKHLILSLGECTYLAVPPFRALSSDHVLIVPTEHVKTLLEADEEVWAEVANFKRSLTKYFHSKGKGILFLETAIGLQQSPHCLLHCIAVSKEVEMDAPIYFKKAIMESESEWSQNKKLIDTSKKGLRRSVPQGFPYFHIEWPGGGFAHVIEDESVFPRTFGLDVISGMMESETLDFGRSAHETSFDEERKTVLGFLKDWERFDWTASLDGGNY